MKKKTFKNTNKNYLHLGRYVEQHQKLLVQFLVVQIYPFQLLDASAHRTTVE